MKRTAVERGRHSITNQAHEMRFARWSRLLSSSGAALVLQTRAAPGATATIAVLTGISAATPAVSAWLMRTLVDALAETATRISLAHVTSLTLGMAAVSGASTIAVYLAQYPTAVAQQRTGIRIETHLFGHVMSLEGLRHLEDPQFRDRLSLANQAARQAPQALVSFTQATIRAGVTIGTFSGALLMVWPPMVIILLATTAVAVVARLSEARRYAQAEEDRTQTVREGELLKFLATDARAGKEIRLFGLGAFMERRLLRALGDAASAILRVDRRGAAVQLALIIAGTVVTAIGLVVVTRGALSGRFTVGDVTLFSAAVFSVQGISASIVIQIAQVRRALELFRHYREVTTSSDPLESGQIAPAPLRHQIEYRDVWFRYDPTGPWVLRRVNLVISANAITGIVGANGAGKSTLVKLLCRLYDPVRGEILWDGTDIRTFNVRALRNRLTASFQDYAMFDFTVQENIGVGDLQGMNDLVRVVRAAQAAEIHDRVQTLPRAYETLLSRTLGDPRIAGPGTTLSGGEWQRIALARSLMRESSDLLILDEPTAGLDPEAEERVHQVLANRRKSRATLLISHRLSALQHAQSIYVVAAGEVAEQGSHQELMAMDGEYARLFRLQATPYEVMANA